MGRSRCQCAKAAFAPPHPCHETTGAPSQALRAECPADLRLKIFDQGWQVVPWHRIADFQNLSLKMISEACTTPARIAE